MLSKWLTEILVLLAVGLGVACVCIWLHEHDIYLFRSFWKRVRKMSIIGLCAAALWAVPFVQLGGTKGGGDGGGSNNVQNVANVEMLPMANSNIQLGNGNIGTGNNFTMAPRARSRATTSGADSSCRASARTRRSTSPRPPARPCVPTGARSARQRTGFMRV